MGGRATLVAAVALLVGGAAVGAVVGLGVFGDDADCPDGAVPTRTANDPAPQFVPAAELAPAGTVGEERRPVLEAAAGLGFGDVLAGRFYRQADEVPAVVPLGEAVLLAAGPRGDSPGTLSVIRVPDGTTAWQRLVDGPLPGGGLVGPDLVLLLGGQVPALLALDPDSGAQRACTAVPTESGGSAGRTLLTDQAGEDVVVLAGPPAAPVTLARLDPGSGEVAWTRRLEGVVETGSVHVVGDHVLVSRLGRDPVRLAEAASGPAGPGAPAWVAAYALADGEPDPALTRRLARLSSPSGGATTVAASTAGDGSTEPGVTLLTSAADGAMSLLAVGPSGALRWRVDLGTGYWDLTPVAEEGLVLAQGPAGDGTVLRAYAEADGTLRWSLRSAAYPSSGPAAPERFGPVTAYDGRLLLPAPNGLVVVDPRTGAAERRDVRLSPTQIIPVGDHLLVRSANALLVIEGRP